MQQNEMRLNIFCKMDLVNEKAMKFYVVKVNFQNEN